MWCHFVRLLTCAVYNVDWMNLPKVWHGIIWYCHNCPGVFLFLLPLKKSTCRVFKSVWFWSTGETVTILHEKPTPQLVTFWASIYSPWAALVCLRRLDCPSCTWHSTGKWPHHHHRSMISIDKTTVIKYLENITNT